MVVGTETPWNSVVALKGKTPQIIDWPKFFRAIFKMQMHMHIGCNMFFSRQFSKFFNKQHKKIVGIIYFLNANSRFQKLVTASNKYLPHIKMIQRNQIF